MFGDDLNATVMTERVGFGEFRTRARGRCTIQRDSGLGKRENEEQSWSRNGQRKQGGNAATTIGCMFLKRKTATSADAMRMMQ